MSAAEGLRHHVATAVDRVVEGTRRRVAAACSEDLVIGLGALHVAQLRAAPPASVAEAELRVFSQGGEDGVIQWLLASLAKPAPEFFVELGVESYREANTRFLLVQRSWPGIIVDAGRDHVRFVRRKRLGVRYGLQAVQRFVTADAVDAMLVEHGTPAEIGVLSIDLDGQDYWILEAIECTRPAIVVAEYNALFGARSTVTVPYDPGFARFAAHPSGLYFGASLGALTHLLERRGYALVGCSTSGVNAFFVRDDLRGSLPAAPPHEAFVPVRWRQARDAGGRLLALAPNGRPVDERSLIADLPVVDVVTGGSRRVGDLA